MLTRSQKIKKFFQRTLLIAIILSSVYLLLLIYPEIMFKYSIAYKQVEVYSDIAIDNNINSVIEDALTRIKKSELYDSSTQFKIYICNDLWRFGMFTQGNSLAGGVTHYHLNNAIYFRPCDIKNNRIIPPKEWYFAKKPFTFSDRPLSYYFAHEMTHKMQSIYTGSFDFSKPTWLTEGYADYVAKAGNFDYEENLKLWHNNAPELDPTKGLYRLYHLKVSYLLDVKGKTLKDIYKDIPNDAIITNQLWDLPYKNDAN